MYDIAIVGLGIYGSLVAKHAAEAGLSVIGFDEHIVPHSEGSSHGDSRLFRYATLENPKYASLAARSAQIWKEMSASSHAQFVTECGTLIAAELGSEGNIDHGVQEIVQRAVRIAVANNIEHEEMLGQRILDRYPHLPIGKFDHVYFEPRAFGIQPEKALLKATADARAAGAELIMQCEVTGIRKRASHFNLSTALGPKDAKNLVIATGPWTAVAKLGQVGPLPSIYPQVIALFPPSKFRGGPAFVRTTRKHGLFYGVPALAGKNQHAKVGCEQYDFSIKDPDHYNRSEIINTLRPQLEVAVSEAGLSMDQVVGIETCLYTLNDSSELRVIVSGNGAIDIRCCSGHGFKYAPAITEKIVQAIQRQNFSTSTDGLLNIY